MKNLLFVYFLFVLQVLVILIILGVDTTVRTEKIEKIEKILKEPTYASPEMMQILTDYSAKPKPLIKNGLYKGTMTIDKRNSLISKEISINYNVFIDDDKITAEFNIPKTDIFARLTTNYHYDGSVLRYNNMKGDVFLLIQDGNAIQSYDKGFALVFGSCNLLEDYEITGDYLCKDNISFIIFKSA